MGRTVMLAGLLMMAGFVGMIMLNLSHAHSELDSLQILVEMQSRELKMIGQANGQMALEIRSKLAILDNLTLKSDQQQANQDQLLQELSTLSSVQQKLSAEMEKFEPRLEEMKQKAGAEEQEVDGVGEEMVDLKEELKQLKLEVSSLSAALERLAVAPAAPAAPKGTERGNEETGAVEPEETEQESPESPAEPAPPGEAEPAEPAEPGTAGIEGLVEAESESKEESENSAEPRPGRPSSETSGAPSPGLKLAGLKVGGSPEQRPPAAANFSKDAAFIQIADAFHQSTAKMPQEILWFKECGCTGIEIEAVRILRGLVARLGADRVKTNKCEQSCSWPAQVHEVLEQIEVEDEHLFPSGSRQVNPGSPPTVLVIHAAFLGVCGVNAHLEQAVQGPAGRKGLVLVSRSMVEVDRLDAEASRDCNRFDYVWVPSAQSREAFLESGLSKDRVKVLPEAVDTSAFSCRSAKVQPPFRSGAQALDNFLAHKPKQSFTFLSMFKWEPRKNWYGLLESFLEAFPEQYTSVRGPNGESRNVSVRLLVKTQILGWSPDDPRQDVPDLLREKRLSEGSLEGRLLVFHDFLNSSEIPKLFKAVDGFILPTHGEGWGLPLIEAMASGIPTISTGWGGHMDFMSKENSWPVSYDLVESQNYGARWAEPRKEALMEAMREVVAGGALVRGKVDRGCDLVHQKYHIDAVANQAVELMIGSLEADIWWGLCEPRPQEYGFQGAKELCDLLKSLDLELQAVMSFHQCGGNVGDTVNFPLPAWCLEVAKSKGLLYKSKDGVVTEDCLSLSADHQKIFPSASSSTRTALQCYQDYMTAFLKAMGQHIGSTVCELQVGMGPCGELRYPSYMMSNGWNWPGVGLIMCYDDGMLKMLKDEVDIQPPEGFPEDQNAMPEDVAMFRAGPKMGFRSGNGKAFLEWYSSVLIHHGKEVLAEAAKAVEKTGQAYPAEKFCFSAKVSGLHWHVTHPSRATEACAGYNCCTSETADAYMEIAKMLAESSTAAKRPVLFNFTCMEMTNDGCSGVPNALSAPEDLIAQVRKAAIFHQVPLAGENALEFDLATGEAAFRQIGKQIRSFSPGLDMMHGLTLLRLSDNFVKPASLQQLARFVTAH